MKLRELPLEFEKKGVKYTQKEKNDKYVLYECNDLEYSCKYYELFEYRTAKPHPLDKNNWDMVELYPSDESFGSWAWCCSNIDSLNRMFKIHFDIDR